MSRPVLVVYNPVSGKGESARFAERLAAALERRGRAAELLATRADADVFAGIETERWGELVVVGGDGSLHAAVNGLRATDMPIGFGGTGTVNVLSLEAGLRDDPEHVAELVCAGHTCRVPLMKANDRKWVLFTEAGFLGTVVQRVNRWRTRTGKHGKFEFVLKALEVLPRAWGRPLRARFELEDGTTRERRYSNVLATRARCYAGNMPMPMAGVGLVSPVFRFVGFRTRTPLGHVCLLALAGTRLLPLMAPLLERVGMIDCASCVALDVEGPATTGVHLDAESVVDGAECRLPLSIECAAASFELVVP